MAQQSLSIFSLPEEIIELIFSFLSYDRKSNIRMVCKDFDRICQRCLNQGFATAEAFHSKCQKRMRSKLPRRESERREHPLSRHSEILNAIETRLSLLDMTFSKYIHIGATCFIPGKVLDELFHVLNVIHKSSVEYELGNSASRSTVLPRPHEILKELRDISSMAMEHFDEIIVPSIKKSSGLDIKPPFKADFSIFSSGSGISFWTKPDVLQSPPLLKNYSKTTLSLHDNQPQAVSCTKIKLMSRELQSVKASNTQIKNELASLSEKCSRHIEEQNRLINEQAKQIKELRKIVVGTSTKLKKKTLKRRLSADTSNKTVSDEETMPDYLSTNKRKVSPKKNSLKCKKLKS